MKTSSLLTTGALVLAAMGLATYAAVVDRGSVTDGERKARENDVFPAYRREDVSRVELTHGGETLVLERRTAPDGGDRGFWLRGPSAGDASPWQEEADASAVDKLLGAIEFAAIVRKVDAQAAAGLDAPRAKGVITMGAVAYRFALGAVAPAQEGAAYFRVDGEGTFVVARDFATELLKGADAYRGRTIVPYLSLDLKRLEVRREGGGFAIERMDDVAFRLPALGVRASREALDRVWSALAETRAEQFVSDADAERATAAPVATIVMTPKDATRPVGEIIVGGECPGLPSDVVVVRKTPTRLAACAPKGVLEGIGVDASALVDRRLFGVRPDETEEAKVQAIPAGLVIELARKGSGWLERSPDARDLQGEDGEVASHLVEAIARASGDDVRPGDANASFAARARVTLVKADLGGEEVVELGAADGAGGAVVRRLADGATLRVPPEVARKLSPSRIALRGRSLWTPPLEGKAPRALGVHCEAVAEELTRDASGWTMREPGRFVADNAGATDLADLLERAKVDAWIADADDGTFGFDKSACKVSLAVDDGPSAAGARAVSVTFGREGEGGVYARVDGDPAVFVLPKSLEDALPRWLVDRDGFRVEPRRILRVTLSKAGARVAFARSGDALAAADGGPSERAEKVEGALASLHADEVVHLGAPRPDEGFGAPALEVRVAVHPDAGARDVRFVVGATALVRNEKMLYARVDGVDATFAIARERLILLFDAL